MSGQKPRQIAAQVLNRIHLDTATIAGKEFPRPTTKEWGEGQGEGPPTKAPTASESPSPRPSTRSSLAGRGSGATRIEFVEDLLEDAFSRSQLMPADRRLCQELVYGVVRWQATLDWLIERKSKAQAQPIVLQNLLRLGLYQVFWLERIPNHAAVNETVELAKSEGFRTRAGFVNALLRGYLRESAATRSALAELKASQPHVGYSHPEWVVSRWQARWGAESTAALMEWNNTPPKTYARVNTLKGDAGKLIEQWRAEGVEFDPVRRDWFDDGLAFELKSHPPLRELASFQQGKFYIQDPSTLLAVRVLDPQPGEAVLDYCAAPGGKLTYIAQLMRNEGLLVAQETSVQRLKLVRENCARLGVTCAETVSAVARSAAFVPRFDKILIDAPCSNTGVMGRRVDLRWRIRLEEIERLKAVQLELLRQAAKLLKPAGILVYSTCSLEPEENVDVVEQFLREQRGFRREEARELLPFRDRVDGAYVARLKALS